VFDSPDAGVGQITMIGLAASGQVRVSASQETQQQTIQRI
jgi:hypothetical protein